MNKIYLIITSQFIWTLFVCYLLYNAKIYFMFKIECILFQIKTDTTHINDWINKSNNNECDKSTAQHILRSQSVYKINLKLYVIRKVESNLKKLKSRKQNYKIICDIYAV